MKRKKNENLTLISIKSMICVTISFRDLFSRVAIRFSFTKLLFFTTILTLWMDEKIFTHSFIALILYSFFNFIHLSAKRFWIAETVWIKSLELATFRGKSNFYDHQNKFICILNSLLPHVSKMCFVTAQTVPSHENFRMFKFSTHQQHF